MNDQYLTYKRNETLTLECRHNLMQKLFHSATLILYAELRLFPHAMYYTPDFVGTLGHRPQSIFFMVGQAKQPCF